MCPRCSFSTTRIRYNLSVMSEFLKGNFRVKRPVAPADKAADKPSFKEEYRKKALGSVGGSMVFVEMDQLHWDGDSEEKSDRPG